MSLPTDRLEINPKCPYQRNKSWIRYLVIFAICACILLLIIFISLFVILPLIFMNSIKMQTCLMFQTFDDEPSDPDFNNSQMYGINGVRNFCVDVGQATLGLWQIVPEKILAEMTGNANFDYEEALKRADQNVILYFHGTGGHRATPVQTYKILRKHFHVIAFDYRGYADSTQIPPSEEGIVEDSIQLYKWLRNHTDGNIFVWGHSLGTALSTHTLARLKNENIVPKGLFLEAAFTTMREEISDNNNPVAKYFSWLPWYEATILNPLEKNGFCFLTAKNILQVDCPIVLLHAEDDPIIPYKLGEKLANIARTQRDLSDKGNVTFYLFPGSYHYKHLDINKAPELPEIIKTHIEVCLEYAGQRIN